MSLNKKQSMDLDVSSQMVEINLSSDSATIPTPVVYQDPVVDKPKVVSRPTQSSLKPIENFDNRLLPFIIKYLDLRDLVTFLEVSWLTFGLASKLVYAKVKFSQLSGFRLRAFLKLLKSSLLSPEGRRQTTIDYSSLVSQLFVSNIVFDGDSELQPWNIVRDIIGIVAPTLEGLDLGFGDESPIDYGFLTSNIEIPKLKHLSLHSKCGRVPYKLVLELLRAAPIGGLKTIRFARCMTNFDASGWFLISERGGESLRDLVLTPSVGPSQLAWDEMFFTQGLETVAKICTSLSRIDISGHIIPISYQVLEDFCRSSKIQELYLPCTMNDAHLLLLMNKPVWPKLKALGFSCMCVDGEKKEQARKNVMSCNRFTDHVLSEFLEHLMAAASISIDIYLPAYLISLKTGKTIETMKWLSSSKQITKRHEDRFWYREKLILSIITNRLLNYL